MGCIFSFKWLFAIIGYNIAHFRGAIFGFLLGMFFDSFFRRPTVHFTYTRSDDWQDFGRQQRAYQPYTVNSKLQDAYRTLGLSETATEDEIRRAYKQLALRYHPDRVASQGEQARQAAEQVFRRINEAKDIVFNARGMR